MTQALYLGAEQAGEEVEIVQPLLVVGAVCPVVNAAGEELQLPSEQERRVDRQGEVQ